MEYLDHVISSEGVSANPSKVEAMVSWPTPQNVRDLREFLGLTGYYRRFVQGYGTIARPLTNLLKKRAFLWANEAAAAFLQLKTAMTKLPVLAMSDFKLPSIGAMLMQDGRPLAFCSKVLSATSWLSSVYERELLAIVLAVQKWGHDLLG